MKRLSRRRKLSMTSLIDVIFLLLLFFMLTSTFTRFAEVELARHGGTGVSPSAPDAFAQLGPENLRINGTQIDLGELAGFMPNIEKPGKTTHVLMSLSEGVTAQRLTDALVAFGQIEALDLTVLGGG